MGIRGGSSTGFIGGLTAALLLGGAAAGVVGIGLGEQVHVAALAGGGVWLLVMLNYWVSRGQERRADLPVTGGRLVETTTTAELVAPPETAAYLRRAETAAAQLAEHHAVGTGARSAVNPALMQILADAAAQTSAAAQQLAARATAVAVIEGVVGETDLRDLRGDQARLEREASLLEPGPLREAKESSARAVADQVASLARMEELRSVLMATLESLTLRLEAIAKHGGMLLSVQLVNDADAHTLDLVPLTAELVEVQRGLERLETLTRDLTAGE